jgi:hypothetical protein
MHVRLRESKTRSRPRGQRAASRTEPDIFPKIQIQISTFHADSHQDLDGRSKQSTGPCHCGNTLHRLPCAVEFDV